MNKEYKLQYLDDKDFEALSAVNPRYANTKDDSGFADMKTNRIFVRKTGLPLMDYFVTAHEIEEILSKNSEHEDEFNIRHKGEEKKEPSKSNYAGDVAAGSQHGVNWFNEQYSKYANYLTQDEWSGLRDKMLPSVQSDPYYGGLGTSYTSPYTKQVSNTVPNVGLAQAVDKYITQKQSGATNSSVNMGAFGSEQSRGEGFRKEPGLFSGGNIGALLGAIATNLLFPGMGLPMTMAAGGLGGAVGKAAGSGIAGESFNIGDIGKTAGIGAAGAGLARGLGFTSAATGAKAGAKGAMEYGAGTPVGTQNMGTWSKFPEGYLGGAAATWPTTAASQLLGMGQTAALPNLGLGGGNTPNVDLGTINVSKPIQAGGVNAPSSSLTERFNATQQMPGITSGGTTPSGGLGFGGLQQATTKQSSLSKIWEKLFPQAEAGKEGGYSWGKTALGAAIPLVGSAFGPKGQTFSAQDSQMFNDITARVQQGNMVKLTPEQSTAITANYDKQLNDAREALVRRYKMVRPGSDISTDTEMKQSVIELENDYAIQKANAITGAEMGLTADQTQMMSQLAAMDIYSLAQAAQISVEEANSFKEMLSNIGIMVATGGENSPYAGLSRMFTGGK